MTRMMWTGIAGMTRNDVNRDSRDDQDDVNRDSRDDRDDVNRDSRDDRE